MALSKNKVKYIHFLKDKKGRLEHGVFVAEGNKMVSELLLCMKCQLLVATPEFLKTIEAPCLIDEIVEASEDDIKKASFLKNPQQVLAVFFQPNYEINSLQIKDKLSLVLDGIQDPGNFGTIIRLADWYGIEDVFCSKDTVNIYNPKTVQATMGALARVKVHYLNLVDFLTQHKKTIPIYGTLLDGNNMYDEELTRNGIIVIGNEGQGISPDIQQLISRKLYIPNYPIDRKTSESLNAAIATAIICAEFRRKYF